MEKPHVKKPRVERDKLPEHIARVGVVRRGMIIDISQPPILRLKGEEKLPPNALAELPSDLLAELPPDPIADPDMRIRVSAALDRITFLQRLATAIATRQETIQELGEIVAMRDPPTASQIRHAANESLHLLRELIAHIEVILTSILPYPAHAGANHRAWQKEGGAKKAGDTVPFTEERNRRWQDDVEELFRNNPRVKTVAKAVAILHKRYKADPMLAKYGDVTRKTMQNNVKKPKP